MRRKTIYPIDWVDCHPYRTANQVDNFYADLANKVFECIKNSGIADAFDEDKEVMKDVAIHLTMYLEDLASEIGVWRAATTEFRKCYGSPLPFFELDDDYEEGFVNREDVRFLLWNEVQCYRGFESFINPENIGIEQVASEIFDLLDKAWETAPSNLRLYDFMHNSAALDSYWNARELIEWFHENAFVCTNTWYDLSEAEEDCKDSQNPDIAIYAFRIEDAFKHKHNMLSISVPKWIGRIRRQEERDIWENIKWKHISFLEYYGDDGERLYLRDLAYDENFMVEKNSFNENFLRKQLKMNDVLYCSLVSFKSTWNQCGQLVGLGKKNDKMQELIDEQRRNLDNLNDQHTMYPKFMELSKGKKMLFFGSTDELKEAYKNLGFKGVDENFKIEFEKNCVLMCSPVNGLVLVFEQAACICDDDNPFYDKEFAKNNALQFYFNENLIDYSDACDLHEGNYLPDAKITSLKGDEYGNKFLHKHGQYIIDYYFSQTREYDYNAKFELNRFRPMKNE